MVVSPRNAVKHPIVPTRLPVVWRVIINRLGMLLSIHFGPLPSSSRHTARPVVAPEEEIGRSGDLPGAVRCPLVLSFGLGSSLRKESRLRFIATTLSQTLPVSILALLRLPTTRLIQDRQGLVHSWTCCAIGDCRLRPPTLAHLSSSVPVVL